MPLSPTYPKLKKSIIDPCDAYDPIKPVEPKAKPNCSKCQFIRSTPSGRLRCTHIELSIHDIHVTAEQQACGLFLSKNKNSVIPKAPKEISKKVTPPKITKKPKIKVGARKVKYDKESTNAN